MKLNLLFFIGWAFLQSPSVFAQLTHTDKEEVISLIGNTLEKKYVFADVALKMKEAISNNYYNKKYDTIVNGSAFAFQLTRDLQSLSGDQHIKVTYSQKKDSAKKNASASNSTDIWEDQLLCENNYGIKEKKILAGNIGFLAIPLFGPLNKCVDTLIAAMEFVSNTDALIIDLQACRGSLDENTIPFFSSYFFKEPVHLSDFYQRETNNLKQFWTQAWVPGKRYLDKPIYIITSSRTFSGGEAFAYDMQQLKRATLVGETTRGGANPSELTALNAQFKISVPYASPVNPITQTNWERVGVKPDSIVKSVLAFYSTHLMVVRKLFQTSASTGQRQILLDAEKTLLERKPQLRTVRFELKGYDNAQEVAVAGSFNFYSPKSLPLKKIGNSWIREIEVEPGEINYMFIVDGKWINDPQNLKSVDVNGQKHSSKVIL